MNKAEIKLHVGKAEMYLCQQKVDAIEEGKS